MLIVGEFHEGGWRVGFFLLPHVGARSAFCECQHIRKIAFKNGEKIFWEKACGAFSQGSYSQVMEVSFQAPQQVLFCPPLRRQPRSWSPQQQPSPGEHRTFQGQIKNAASQGLITGERYPEPPQLEEQLYTLSPQK